MMEFLEQLEWIVWMDSRQQSKVRHKLKDILVITLFATFADADDWVEIGMFAKIHEADSAEIYRVGKRGSVARYDSTGDGDDVAGVFATDSGSVSGDVESGKRRKAEKDSLD